MKFGGAGDEGNREQPTGGQQRGDDEQKAKVVPLPRDWLGPREGLVPFGPSAAPGPQELESELHDPDRRSGEAFWGEQSASVQDTLDQGDPAGLAGNRPGFVFRTRDLRRPAVALGIAAALALAVVGYLTALGPSASLRHSPPLSELGLAGKGTSSPWSLLRPRQVHHPATASDRSSRRARRGGRTVPVRYARQTSSSATTPQTTATAPSEQTSAASPVLTTTSPTISSPPPSPINRPRSKSSSRPFGAHGLLGPGKSPSG